MAEIIFSAFSDEYATPFEEQLKGMKEFGIKNIEMRFIDGKSIADLSMEEAKVAKSLLQKYDISVSAIGSPLGKIRLDEDFEAHLKTAENVFSLANYFGAKYIRMFSFYAPKDKDIADYKDEVLEKIGRLIALSKKNNVTLCHENEALIYGDTPSRCLEILEHFGGELKCVFDMGNFVLENANPYPNGYDMLKEYIEYFHIKDALFEGAIVPAGKGDAKIKKIIFAHKEYAKKDFFVTLEPHLQTFSGLNALVGRSFENPYKYDDEKSAFTDAVTKFKELVF